MNLRNIIKQITHQSDSKIWKKYIHYIFPTVLVMILVMNFTVYRAVSDDIQAKTREMALQTVTIQSDNLSNLLYRYIGDLNILKSYFTPDDMTGFIKKANETLYKHSNEWAYLRITVPDGTTWTNYTDLDTVNAKIRKYFREIFIEKKDISFRISHHTDIIKDDVFSVTIPVKDTSGNAIASLSATFSTGKMDKMLQKMKINGEGFVALVDENLNMRVLSDSYSNTTAEETEKKGNKGFYKLYDNFMRNYKVNDRGEYYNEEGNKMVAYFAKINGTPWGVCINVAASVVRSSSTLTLKIMIVLTTVVLILILIFVKVITDRYVLTPLGEINEIAKDFAKGKLYSVPLKLEGEHNFKSTTDEFSVLKNSLQSMQSRLSEMVKNIQEYSESFNKGSKVWSQSVSNISADAKIQQRTVEEISASINQIIDSIKETNEKTQDTRDASDSISKDIQDVTKSSENSLIYLKNVLMKQKVINEITTRTDLLAINAAVEASRAGENGKGFAVVAAEIRKLSERCQQASAEINRSSAESLNITRHAVELIDKISPKIKETADKIAEISEICLDQISKTESVHRAVMQLADITANNRLSADQMTEYSKQINEKLAVLNAGTDFFQVDTLKKLKRQEIISMIEDHTKDILKLKTELIKVAENPAIVDEVNSIIDSSINEAKEISQYKDTEEGFGFFEEETSNHEDNSTDEKSPDDSQTHYKGVKLDMGDKDYENF